MIETLEKWAGVALIGAKLDAGRWYILPVAWKHWISLSDYLKCKGYQPSHYRYSNDSAESTV
jgi:hypothetical protein